MAVYAETVTVEELDRDPYPVYLRLRTEEPVAWVPAVNLWLVTRANDVEYVATHPELFTAHVADSPLDTSAPRGAECPRVRISAMTIAATAPQNNTITTIATIQ